MTGHSYDDDAAGMIKPAAIFIMGASRLQAIAPPQARAIVTRPTSGRRRKSKSFRSGPNSSPSRRGIQTGETAAGYAKEMWRSIRRNRRRSPLPILLAGHCHPTALIPGVRRRSCDGAMVESMRPGSVIVYLASNVAETANCRKPARRSCQKTASKSLPVNIMTLAERRRALRKKICWLSLKR